jgi:hypothetical protein
MKSATNVRSWFTKEQLLEDLQYKLTPKLFEALSTRMDGGSYDREPFSEHMRYLKRIDSKYRHRAKMDADHAAKQKARMFAEQYAKANDEAKAKKPGKYAILSRPSSDSGYESNDLAEFRR